jgi:predicted NBD/HSP70 family sugar kinase
MYSAAGLDDSATADTRAMTAPWWPVTECGLTEAAAATALAVKSAACLLDLDGVIVDGSISRELLTTLQREVGKAFDRHGWEDVVRPPVLPGTVGPDTRAIGGALLPLYAKFAPDRDLLLKLGS